MTDIQKIVEALANLIGHAAWVANEFDIHYAHLAEATASLALAERMQAEAGKAAKEAKDLAWSLRTRAAKDAVRYGGMGYYSKGDALLDIKAADEIERLSRELEAAKAGGKAA